MLCCNYEIALNCFAVYAKHQPKAFMNRMNAMTALRGGGATYLHQICLISSLWRGEVSFCVTEISLFLENIQNNQCRSFFENWCTFVSLD